MTKTALQQAVDCLGAISCHQIMIKNDLPDSVDYSPFVEAGAKSHLTFGEEEAAKAFRILMCLKTGVSEDVKT